MLNLDNEKDLGNFLNLPAKQRQMISLGINEEELEKLYIQYEESSKRELKWQTHNHRRTLQKIQKRV